MINIKNKCAECEHQKICKYSETYTETYTELDNIKSDLSNKLDHKIIAEGIAQIEILCKYYKPITSSIRKSIPMICDPAYEESIKSSFDLY